MHLAHLALDHIGLEAHHVLGEADRQLVCGVVELGA